MSSVSKSKHLLVKNIRNLHKKFSNNNFSSILQSPIAELEKSKKLKFSKESQELKELKEEEESDYSLPKME